MAVETGPRALHLGQTVSPADALGPKLIEPADLTTHGVIVGMTGSGKTGLGLILLEELLASGRPILAIDPKGDVGNLLLAHAEHTAALLTPWIDPGEAARQAVSPAELAQTTAATWEKGLADSGLSPAKRSAIALAPKTLFTPGSSSGVPLSLLGSLEPPDLDWQSGAETLRDEIQGLVSGLLTLAGLDSDPVTSPEHILLATLVEHAWRAGTALDLPGLLAGVQRPPFRKLGVLDLDTFYPAQERAKLLGRLNGLLASPSFQSWLEGPPLDVERVLGPREGRATIISVAHLSETERLSVVTLVLSKVVTWMRRQSGTGDLRALIYIDEMFGFAPPTAEPPSKKPLLTLMKTARAYGLGLVLATQNPMDLDYKAMSNAGTWMIGRLQTDRDKARVLEGLAGVRSSADPATLDSAITGLAKRQFLHQSVKADQPSVFATRWAVSYLAGPLSLPQIRALTENDPLRAVSRASVPAHSGQSSSSAPTADEAAPTDTRPATDHESPVMPPVAEGVRVCFADGGADWLRDVGADPMSPRLAAALVAAVNVKFDDARAGVDHDESYELVVFPLDASLDPASVRTVDFDGRDFVEDAPDGALYVLPSAPIHTKTYVQQVSRQLTDYIAQSRDLRLWHCPALKSYSRAGETRDEFEARMQALAAARADEEAAAERARMEKKAQSLRVAAEAARDRLAEAEVALDAQKREELIAGTGGVMGALFGGRLTTKGILSRASRAMSGSARERSQTQRAQARVGTLEERADTSQDALEDFEQAILDRLAEIDTRWSEAAAAIQETGIGLERADVKVGDAFVCWLPVPTVPTRG